MIMKRSILTLAVNTMFATTTSAQGVQPMTRTTNWLAACHATLGVNVTSNWLFDHDMDAVEIYTTSGNTLILVDRAPIITGDGVASLRKGIHGLGGTHMSLVGELRHVNDSLIHGIYSGSLGGTAMLMDQYVQLRNHVPIAVVRVITRANGPAPANAVDQRHVKALLRRPDH
jgi:hypothetical protein